MMFKQHREPRTLDEDALRAEQISLRSRPFRSAKDAERLRAIGRKLESIARRSPYKH